MNDSDGPLRPEVSAEGDDPLLGEYPPFELTTISAHDVARMPAKKPGPVTLLDRQGVFAHSFKCSIWTWSSWSSRGGPTATGRLHVLPRVRGAHADDPLAGPDLREPRVLLRRSRARDLPGVLPLQRRLDARLCVSHLL